MRRHWSYLKYVCRHKWYVFLACRRVGVPLWIAVIHDWTKFTLKEWSPYARQFFNEDGSKRVVRDSSGAYDPAKKGLDFQFAWLNHQRNKHHWQAWCIVGDSGSMTPLPIPEMYLREMVADWIGAGWAIGGVRDCRPWYQKNKEKIVMDDESRTMLECLIDMT